MIPTATNTIRDLSIPEAASCFEKDSWIPTATNTSAHAARYQLIPIATNDVRDGSILAAAARAARD